VGSDIEVDWTLPTLRILENSHLLGGFLIIPNNIDFCDKRAFH